MKKQCAPWLLGCHLQYWVQNTVVTLSGYIGQPYRLSSSNSSCALLFKDCIICNDSCLQTPILRLSDDEAVLCALRRCRQMFARLQFCDYYHNYMTTMWTCLDTLHDCEMRCSFATTLDWISSIFLPFLSSWISSTCRSMTAVLACFLAMPLAPPVPKH